MNWDEYFLRLVYLVSNKSKDPRTKIGSVIVRDNGIISTGFNNFPRKVADLPERYNDRETKYKFICHSEASAVLQCARIGVTALDATLYTQGYPCYECCKSIIQSGIKEIVLHKQWPDLTYSEKWVESYKISKLMLEETGIKVRYFDKILGIKGFIDNQEIDV